jgi:nitrate reductase gamma subunit
MDQFIFLTLPYVTIFVFAVGLICRIRIWWAKPRAKAVLFPAAKSNSAVVGRVIEDIVLFGKTFSMSKSLWAMTVLFHLGLLLVVLGHIRTVVEIGFLWRWFNIPGAEIDHVAFAMGMTAGGLVLAGVILLLTRRFTPKMRTLSIFDDYFVLGMLLVIIMTGLSMRLWMPIDAAIIQHYARGVLTLQPAVEINNILFTWHFFLAQILIMYLPFSKLVHLVSKPIAESWTMR